MLFRDVVSNVALGRQDKNVLAFYIKRLSEEQTSRTITAFLAVVLVAFQTITFLVPPKVSEASGGSSNDIIYGGFKDKNDLLAKYDSNQELKNIYFGMGIGREQIQNATMSSVNSNQNVWSLGRNPHGDPGVNWPQSIPGAHSTIYLRPLSVWGKNLTYRGLHGVSGRGEQFWILPDCGNPVLLVSTSQPAEKTTSTPQPATPQPTPTPTPQPTPTPTPTPQSTPTPSRTPTPSATPTPQPSYACLGLSAYPDAANPKLAPPLTVTFRTSKRLENTSLVAYQYDFGDGSSLATQDEQVTHTYLAAGTYTARVQVQTIAGLTEKSSVCEAKIAVHSPNLVYRKQAVNLSVADKNGQPSNAASTTAQAGHQIRYTLSVANTGKGGYDGFIFDENIADILDYATVTNLGGGKLVNEPIPGQPGLIPKSLVWDKVDIAAGQTVTKTFVVTLKSPIPATPLGKSDPNSFDLQMENTFYKNHITIAVARPTVKQAEAVSQSLPQTGSGAATTALALFASGATFILLRNRLIRKELEILATTGEV